jgi:tRNA uridine 5-carboxymethylaminomethyl modification enzyme
MDRLTSVLPEISQYPARVRQRVTIEATYAPYIKMQASERSKFMNDEQILLPTDLNYDTVPGLAIAEKQVLNATRPETLAQARRVEGVTPAGSIRLLAYVRRHGIACSTSELEAAP